MRLPNLVGKRLAVPIDSMNSLCRDVILRGALSLRGSDFQYADARINITEPSQAIEVDAACSLMADFNPFDKYTRIVPSCCFSVMLNILLEM